MDFFSLDVAHYFNLANKFFEGQAPYKDYFVNYLPGAFLFFLTPRLLTTQLIPYFVAFSSLVMIFFLFGLSFLIREWEKAGKEKIWLVILILSSILILPLSLMRFDLFPTILTLVALNIFLRKGFLLGEFYLALGAVTKIFPAIFLPFFLIEFWQKKEKVRALKGLSVFFLTSFIVLLPYIAFGGGKGLLDSLEYNFDRTIQIESVPASFLFAGFLLGKPVETFGAFASWNVGSNWDGGLTSAFLILWLTAFAWLFFWFYRRTKIIKDVREKEFLLIKAVLIAILITVSFSRTFSPQYLIWSWPFTLWFFLYLTKTRMVVLGSLWCLILFITMLNLARYTELIALEPLAVSSGILRNILYLALLVGVAATSISEGNVKEAV
ncbi:DUF2029 domain-containing protein [Candidatus Microgenomates bacterium]|nr:DUF2029 domain-containing protein [Candidatus Microgenomates bacterium]